MGFSKTTSCAPAKRLALTNSATSRSSATRPLPDSTRTGRAAIAQPSYQPRYLQPTAATTARRVGTTAGTRPDPSSNRPSTISCECFCHCLDRSSAPAPRESADLLEMKRKISQLDLEFVTYKTKSEILEMQLAVCRQTSLDCLKQMKQIINRMKEQLISSHNGSGKRKA
ncbi:hypothetical protein COOONC_28603 [Cooperia oncophora]